MNLTPDQLKIAKDLDNAIRSVSKIREQFKEYRLGDIYLMERCDFYNKSVFHVEETSIGLPAKFKVVYISDEGVPYLRRITKSGNPTGDAWVPPDAITLSLLRCIKDPYAEERFHRFVPDPEQLDAIILQEEFDPMAQHRDKSKLFNEINKHNKSVLVPTNNYEFNKAIVFLKSLVAGDKFWTAVDKQYVVQSVAKVNNKWNITCTDMNHATVSFNLSHFQGRRLYKAQPRSFAKESAT